jgi:hypothetical protein
MSVRAFCGKEVGFSIGIEDEACSGRHPAGLDSTANAGKGEQQPFLPQQPDGESRA